MTLTPDEIAAKLQATEIVLRIRRRERDPRVRAFLAQEAVRLCVEATRGVTTAELQARAAAGYGPVITSGGSA
jgi:hypothetical protein